MQKCTFAEVEAYMFECWQRWQASWHTIYPNSHYKSDCYTVFYLFS